MNFKYYFLPKFPCQNLERATTKYKHHERTIQKNNLEEDQKYF
jgi:hypothetical protein